MTEVERKLADVLGTAVAGTELPERLRTPSHLLPAATRHRSKWLGFAAAVLLCLATAGVTAARGGFLSFGQSGDAFSLERQVRMAERDAPEIGSLALTSPLANAPVAVPYGLQTQPMRTETALHPGIDLSAAKGGQIVAAAAGTVAATGSHPDLGLVVVVTHGKIDGVPVSTWYGHVGRFLVQAGDTIRAGQPLATVGTTGLATGPTLHFEVRLGGKATDPTQWLPRP
jgi:murein DD-endopeptidase MepM/ murein hydrolase activator NlpD